MLTKSLSFKFRFVGAVARESLPPSSGAPLATDILSWLQYSPPTYCRDKEDEKLHVNTPFVLLAWRLTNQPQFFPLCNSPPAGQVLIIIEVLSPHSTLRHTTVGRTPLDEWSARRIDLYLTTHNTHNRETSMPPPTRRLSNQQFQQANCRRHTP